MADYKGIKGYSVQKLASDPTTADTLGQLFFNSASNEWKFSSQSGAAWSAGGNLVTPRYRLAGTGPSSASLMLGGIPPAGAPTLSATEEYDGTTWSEVNNVPVGPGWPGVQSADVTGIVTAALYCSGDEGPSPANESLDYDGTNWTAGGNRVNPVPQPRSILRATGCGPSGAALTAAGEPVPWEGYTNVTESYNGTTWSELNTYPISTSEVQIFGTTAAAIGAGGYPGAPDRKYVADWDGTSWSAGTNLTTGRTEHGSSHNGSYTLSIVFGGSPGPTGNTEEWNGSTWTETADLLSARNAMGSGGTISGTICAGGYNNFNTSETFSNAPIRTKTITTS